MSAAEERDLVAGIMRLANVLTRRLAPVFEKSNITPQQWAVLVAIAGRPMSLAAVARRLSVSKQNMTGMIARLEQLALVERSENPQDLRAAVLALTRRGRTLVEKLTPLYEEWRNSLGRNLPERDLQTLTRTVNRLIGQLSTD